MRKPELHIARDWFLSFQAGEEEGFDHYFKTFYKALYFFAKGYCNETAGAEDIVVACFMKLWEHRATIENERHLVSWLYQAVYRKCMDEAKRRERRERRETEATKVAEAIERDFEENIIRAETIRLLHEAINLLPEQCKKIFYKLYIEGKSSKETAEEMQLTVSTIDNQKARGIKLLRERLVNKVMGSLFLL